MRVVKELTYPACKVTLFAWNNRYIIKLEQGLLEQTFKIDETEFANDDDVIRLLDAEFLQQAIIRFRQMGQSVYEAVQRTQT